MTTTDAPVTAEPGDFLRLTAPPEEVARWNALSAAADAAQKRAGELQTALAEAQQQLANLDRAAQDRIAQRSAAEAARDAAIGARDLQALKEAAGDLAAYDALDTFDAAAREQLVARVRDLAETLLPDAVAEAERARSEADAAHSGRTPRRLINGLVLWQIERLARLARTEGDDAAEFCADMVGLADRTARHAHEDREWLETMVRGMEASSSTSAPTAPRTRAEREQIAREWFEDEAREQRVREALAVGAQGIQFGASTFAPLGAM